MRISDWSSDVCSSDLPGTLVLRQAESVPRADGTHLEGVDRQLEVVDGRRGGGEVEDEVDLARHVNEVGDVAPDERSEEGRGGKEGVSTGRSRWSPEHLTKKIRTQHHASTY